MGVDINCYIECLQDSNWQFVGEIVENEDRKYDPEAPEFAPKPILYAGYREMAAILLGIDYEIRATEPYMGIVPHRGKPNDLSPELENYFSYDDGDEAFVYSWFTARELIDFDLPSRTMKRQAYVPKEAAHLFKDCPDRFPLDQWPEGIEVSIAQWSREGTEVTWNETYDKIIPGFVDTVPPALADVGQPEKTRVIVEAWW